MDDTPEFIGSLAEISETVATSLLSSGSSIMPADALDIIKTETLFYQGYTDLDGHKDVSVKLLPDNFKLTASEWSVIQPVVMAGCKLLHANRMEASGSIGAQHFGLDVSTAQQLYDTARLDMPKNAFVSPPYSLNFDDEV